MGTVEDEWIDKLFACMDDFFKKKWTSQFESSYLIKLYGTKERVMASRKTIWKNAIKGLSYDEIKLCLQVLKIRTRNPDVYPPTCIEFYLLAKSLASVDKKQLGANSTRSSHPLGADSTISNGETAKNELNKIRGLL